MDGQGERYGEKKRNCRMESSVTDKWMKVGET